MYNPEKCLNLCRQMLTVTPAIWQLPAGTAMNCQSLVFRTKTGLEAALPPFWYYYTTRHPKAPCSGIRGPFWTCWQNHAGQPAGACQNLNTKKGAALADYPLVLRLVRCSRIEQFF